MGKTIHIFLEDQEDEEKIIFYRGKITEHDEEREITEHDEEGEEGRHHVIYADGDESWEELEKTMVIWDNGLMTAEGSNWIEDIEESEKGKPEALGAAPAEADMLQEPQGGQQLMSAVQPKPPAPQPSPGQAEEEVLDIIGTSKPQSTVPAVPIDEVVVPPPLDGTKPQEGPSPEAEMEAEAVKPESDAADIQVEAQDKVVPKSASKLKVVGPAQPTPAPPRSASSKRPRPVEGEETQRKSETTVAKKKRPEGTPTAQGMGEALKPTEEPAAGARAAAAGLGAKSTDQQLVLLKHQLVEKGNKVRDSLRTLTTASADLMKAADAIAKIPVTQDSIEAIKRELFNHVRGLTGFFLRGAEEAAARRKDIGVLEGHAWSKLESTVMEPLLAFSNILNTWLAFEGKPLMAEGITLRTWKAKQDGGMATTAGIRSASQEHQAPAITEIKPHPPLPVVSPPAPTVVPESDSLNEVFRSTGDKTRDDAIRVLAHSLATASTPVEAAVEIEQVLFARYCKETREANEEYMRRLRSIWGALSPQGEQCRPLLRYMLLTGMLGPGELVLVTSEELAAKEAEAKKEMLNCKAGWLSRTLAAVQVPEGNARGGAEQLSPAAAQPSGAAKEEHPGVNLGEAPLPLVDEMDTGE